MKSYLISNLLSLLRCPLAFLFLKKDLYIRLAALSFALISDFLDGFIARRFSATSKFGAVLDPLMDRFFVIFVSSVMLLEKQLNSSELLLLVSRDIFLIGVGFYLFFQKGLKQFTIKATYMGKITTVAQFAVLFILSFGFLEMPKFTYPTFLVLGALTAIEVIIRELKSPL
ncbi:MAG: CDP-alcohol phosphatidyltransferase family protein [Chlamydiales bacterium]|nr:CDP-alcohol phosphatidyltransferase family protein [Chlamydiales bacterium]